MGEGPKLEITSESTLKCPQHRNIFRWRKWNYKPILNSEHTTKLLAMLVFLLIFRKSSKSLKNKTLWYFFRVSQNVAPWRSCYHYYTTSFNKAWTQVRRMCKSCSRRVRDSRWWESQTMIPSGNKTKPFWSVNHTTKNNSSFITARCQQGAGEGWWWECLSIPPVGSWEIFLGGEFF